MSGEGRSLIGVSWWPSVTRPGRGLWMVSFNCDGWDVGSLTGFAVVDDFGDLVRVFP